MTKEEKAIIYCQSQNIQFGAMEFASSQIESFCKKDFIAGFESSEQVNDTTMIAFAKYCGENATLVMIDNAQWWKTKKNDYLKPSDLLIAFKEIQNNNRLPVDDEQH